jgi:HAMP domain-containing protein
VFLITGAILLTLGYLLVRHNLNSHGDFRQALARLGVPPAGASVGRRLRFLPGSADFRVFAELRAQLRADALHRLLLEYLLALGAMTAVSVAAGWLLAGRALRPLRQITATARRVSGENLGERIALSGPADELKELATRSTECSPGWTTRSAASAISSPTPRTSCALRWRLCAPNSTSRCRIP